MTFDTGEKKVDKKYNTGELFLPPHLRVNKVSLVVVETSLAEATVRQRLLQEVPAIQLMPRVLDLSRNKSAYQWHIIFLIIFSVTFYLKFIDRYNVLTSTGSTSTDRPSRFFLTVVTSSLAKYAVWSSWSFNKRSSSFFVSLRMCYKR